jgi:hypothetical protein
MGTGAISTHCTGLVGPILPGSESRAHAHGGSLGTWEIPLLSALNRREGHPADQVPGSWTGPLASTRAKLQSAGAVPPREGNEACGMDAGSLKPFIVPSESRETAPEEAGE